jgi:hypothetical protein
MLTRGGIKPQIKKVQAILAKIAAQQCQEVKALPWNGTILP